MKAFYALVAAVAVVAVVTDAKSFSTQERHPIEWYNCTGKRDGNYIHPNDCTRFISCSGNVASERDCSTCRVDPVTCPDGRLIYNATVNECMWPDSTRCEVGGETPVTGNPITDPTSSPPQQEEPPKEGDACNPEICRNTGYCQSYLRCDKNSSRLVREECGENLAWNPLNPNGTEQVHGGNCDIWSNLSPATERRYRSDEDCLACFWRATGECAADYLYQAPNGTHRNVLTLSCADGLLFSPEKETCQRCEDVRSTNGTDCCPR